MQNDYGDVVTIRILKETLYFIFSPAMVRQIIVGSTHHLIRQEHQIDVFTKAHGASVLTTEGDTWKRQRKIINSAFSLNRVTGYLNLMHRAVVDNFNATLPITVGQSVSLDVDQFTTKITMDVILRALFSLRVPDAKSVEMSRAIRKLTEQGMKELYWPITPPEWCPYPGKAVVRKNRGVINDLISEQIEARQKKTTAMTGKTDLLQMLLLAKDDDASQEKRGAQLSSQEILDNCKTIFYAGHDTSATALTWWLALMAAYPDYAEKIRAEVNELFDVDNPSRDSLDSLVLLNASIKEAMRLYPPATALFQRRATQDIQVDDFLIPKKSLISIPIWHIHRDSRWYENPECFYPERFLSGGAEIPKNAFMPFGLGPRICLGQHFAHQEITLIAAMFLKRYKIEFEQGHGLPDTTLDVVLKPALPVQLKFTRLI